MDRFYDIDRIVTDIISGGDGVTYGEALALSRDCSTGELESAAAKVTAACSSKKFDTCSIVNAKSGRCSEDCHWCAQSAHYHTGAAEYPLKLVDEMLNAAKESWKHGIGRFSFVTSGKALSDKDVDKICEAAAAILKECGISLCMSSGLLDRQQLERIKAAGISRYHCNLESAPSFFGKLCSTHSQQQKIDTLHAAREVGLEICSGGIIGMGETEQQRIELAFTLKKLGVLSVPINILCPVKGTPLAEMPPIGDDEVLRCVALFRLIMPKAYLRFAGGVARFSEATMVRAYRAGINAAILGDMLTTAGEDIQTNMKRIRGAGYEF